MTARPKKSEPKTFKQLSLLPNEGAIAPEAGKKPAKKSSKKPPTDLMMLVASKAPVPKKMKKAFTEEEVKEILSGNVSFLTEEEKAEREAKAQFKKDYKRIKRWVLDAEATNRDKLIFFQSSYEGEFYKALNFSALYYSYRLAHQMGRKSNVMVDTDRFSKALYVASIANINKFVEQYKELEGLKPEITLDGVYIFPLKKALDDVEVSMLYQTEKTRQEKMHNILKPKQMAPAVYQQILMVIRQLAPRSTKLEKAAIDFQSFGNDMLRNLRDILVIYAEFSNGRYSKGETVDLIFSEIGKIKATLIILGETRKWGAVPLSSLGDKINLLEQLVVKDLDGCDE